MNEDKLMSKSPKTIKRRGFYATLASGLAGVFSAVTFGLVATPKKLLQCQSEFTSSGC